MTVCAVAVGIAHAVKREGTGVVGHQLQSSTFAGQVLAQRTPLLWPWRAIKPGNSVEDERRRHK
jgi:hypothetical protein